jgi:glycosyltransferase involved in cell wall biosynthesis
MTSSNKHSRTSEIIVVVPCFNEALRLQTTAFSEFLDRSTNVTLLFVDDGSIDDTPFVLERLRQRHPRQVCTLRLSANVGKAEAVRRGMLIALRRQPTVVGYWDADLATPLDAISRFVEVMTTRAELRLVMGSRVALLGRHVQRSSLRHFIGRVFATAASAVLRLSVYDTQCGAKLFRNSPDLSALLESRFQSRWVFDVEILVRIVAASHLPGSPPAHKLIYEYPLDQWQDVHGTHLRPLDFLIAAIDLAAIYWRYRRSRSVERNLRVDGVAAPADSTSHEVTGRNAA